MTLRSAALTLALAPALACANAPASPPAVPTPSASASATSSASPPDPDATPKCEKGPEHYGAWRPSAADIARVAPIFVVTDCGPKDWRGPAIKACIDELKQPSVTVMYGEMTGNKGTPHACQLSVSGAEWGGRRFIVVHDFFRHEGTFWAFNSIYEVTGGAPVVFLDGGENYTALCDSPDPATPQPPGWKSFPADLQKYFCGH
jgi:hypothetical protein